MRLASHVRQPSTAGRPEKQNKTLASRASSLLWMFQVWISLLQLVLGMVGASVFRPAVFGRSF